MAYYWNGKYHPSKDDKAEYAEKMREIEAFCEEKSIHRSLGGSSYYFTLNGQDYRVSNHTVDASNRKAYREDGYGREVQIREEYHPGGETSDTVYITAGKLRIIEIYTALAEGKKLDRRGRVVAS
ncbi:hypothetical protein LJC60_05620 [Ruminococcaceae bacterium OttesenSCG-928-D13]|nr:hypothetical protein [Ruminococcaceae bacterium OttesenSCG-928-D13]